MSLHRGAVFFATDPEEQKMRNLDANAQVAVTTGANTWAKGLDVVVEGSAVRVIDPRELPEAAEAYAAKYGEVWRFVVGGGGVLVETDGHPSHLFRVAPGRVLSFAKDPHDQTRFRFTT